MPLRLDSGSLTIVLSSESHSSADLRLVVDALDGLVAAGIWGSLAAEVTEQEDLQRARTILKQEIGRGKSGGRFFPRWALGHDPESESDLIGRDDSEFEPVDPMDGGIRDGMNSFLRRTLWTRDPALYRRIFGFATIDRVEHHSPLLITLGVTIAAGITLPAVLILGLMRATAVLRRTFAEADIREIESEIRREELKQKRLQTQILTEVAAAAEGLGPANIPRAAIEKASEVSTTAVSDLGSSSMIGSVTFSLTSKAA